MTTVNVLKRKLIVCCDGTWNVPNQKGGPTNVVKMLRAINPVDAVGAAQIVHYSTGVGTGNWFDRFTGGTIGVGLTSNVQSAYGFLVDNYYPDDQIYLFGFSRGAFTVRSLAGFIDLVGLVQKGDMELFQEIFEVYRKHPINRTSNRAEDLAAAFREHLPAATYERLLAALKRSRRMKIMFIGVWDTVGALGVPLGPLRWIGRSQYKFHSTRLGSSVRFAYQALAIDEHRRAFPPSVWFRPIKTKDGSLSSKSQTLEQVWFAGAHSNVGGGYVDSALADMAFLWMVSKATAARTDGEPLALNEEYLALTIQKTMGLLVNSRTLKWRLRRSLIRKMLDLNRFSEGMETCEKVHRSVLLRYNCQDRGKLPEPYRPTNKPDFFEHPDQALVAELSDLEKKHGGYDAML